ncbi:hypothetical protein [Sphingobium xenophagum]|nr:hypothetical protein [Sphingobium xenophagum]
MAEFQEARARMLLRKLVADENYTHPMSVIRRVAGQEIADRITAERDNLANYNKVAKANVPALSADAMHYWTEAQSVLAYGRLALSQGSRTAERALSRKCEALDESFANRVPDREKGHFLMYDIHDLDGKNWDDRWLSCIDFYFPLLREIGTSATITNTMRVAQINILAPLSADED